MVRFLIECDNMNTPTTPAGCVFKEVYASATTLKILGLPAAFCFTQNVGNVELWNFENKNADTRGGISLDVPIGRTEFVDGILSRQTHGSVTNVRPLLVPDCLNRKDFVQRRIGRVFNISEMMTVQQCWNAKSVYVTDAERVHSANLDSFILENEVENGEFMISEEMPQCVSIWRIFFQHDTVIRMNIMKGSQNKEANSDFVTQVCTTFVMSGHAPQAFFMDFGVRSDGSTFLIQVFNAISNYGLYGILDKTDTVASMLLWGWLNELAIAKAVDAYALPFLLQYAKYF